jgi:uncharacterized protein (TIGR00369 family)
MFPSSITDILHAKLGDRLSEYLLPPPVFATMEGEFISFDMENNALQTRFPVQERYLNPYRSLQGGIIAAAVDNTIGPLSMLVAPPNVTRRLEVKYSRPVTMDMGQILVTGKLVNRNGRKLSFRAAVRDPHGNLLAKAQSTHLIVKMD